MSFQCLLIYMSLYKLFLNVYNLVALKIIISQKYFCFQKT
jgi:hypothetical protein